MTLFHSRRCLSRVTMSVVVIIMASRLTFAEEDRQAKSEGDQKTNNLTITSEIANMVEITQAERDAWIVKQLKARDEVPAGSRPPDYAQAPTWVRIENYREARAISLAVQ